MAGKFQPGDKVKLVGGHPRAGQSGTVEYAKLNSAYSVRSGDDKHSFNANEDQLVMHQEHVPRRMGDLKSS